MKSRLYTRIGDDGTTSLVDGTRTAKDGLRVEAYGEVDELSSMLGLLASWHDCPEELKGQIAAIQNVMFEIGGYLATPQGEDARPLEGIDADTQQLEGWIDTLDEQTPEMKYFVLPGGCEGSARCHLARTVCRRAERHVIQLSREEYVDRAVISYLNRLSDYLFIAARYMNFISGVADIAWHPRQKNKK